VQADQVIQPVIIDIPYREIVGRIVVIESEGIERLKSTVTITDVKHD
jgi:hypothetical protein